MRTSQARSKKQWAMRSIVSRSKECAYSAVMIAMDPVWSHRAELILFSLSNISTAASSILTFSYSVDSVTISNLNTLYS